MVSLRKMVGEVHLLSGEDVNREMLGLEVGVERIAGPGDAPKYQRGV